MKKSTTKTARRSAARPARSAATTTRKPAKSAAGSTATILRKPTRNPKKRHLQENTEFEGAFTRASLLRFLARIEADQARRSKAEGGETLRVTTVIDFEYIDVVIGSITRYHIDLGTGLIFGVRRGQKCRTENYGLIQHASQYDWSGYWPRKKGETHVRKPLPEARKIRVFKAEEA